MIGPVLALPDAGNNFQNDYVGRVVASYSRVTGGDLIEEYGLDGNDLGRSTWFGNFALLSHRGDAGATMNYGNEFALSLWECDWQTLIAMPSSATAPPQDQTERNAALGAVASAGFVKDYTGRRISRPGRLFLIKGVTIWRLIDPSGKSFGVAATFREFERL